MKFSSVATHVLLIGISWARCSSAFAPRTSARGTSHGFSPSVERFATSTSETEDLSQVVSELQKTFSPAEADLVKSCKVQVGASTSSRLGMFATENLKKGEVVLNMPYGEVELTADTARNTVFKGVLEDSYEGWTGDTGLIALQILNEVARLSGSGISEPSRSAGLQAFFGAWIQALPSPNTMDHPLLWSEEDQEVLQSSSTTKVYRALDDVEEDANWLVENVFSKNRDQFPETAKWNGEDIPCFSAAGYTWAVAMTKSRTVFVDGKLRLLPLLDFFNHDDEANEIRGGTMGAFGTIKGAQVVTDRAYKKGEEVFVSYGPKSAADYLLEHGFCPPQSFKTSVSEITLEVDPEDKFYDDKLDILEFETYDQAPMDPSQSFDLISAVGRDGELDPALVQFARLSQLGAQDAFLLESIFKKEVWGFMAYPVSEKNELAVVEQISAHCESTLEDFSKCPDGGPEVCGQLRESETKAVKRTLEFLSREKQALDLKEYYQERRLKDLGLDSDWSPEDDMSPDVGYGQTRAPGGADYDF